MSLFSLINQLPAILVLQTAPKVPPRAAAPTTCKKSEKPAAWPLYLDTDFMACQVAQQIPDVLNPLVDFLRPDGSVKSFRTEVLNGDRGSLDEITWQQVASFVYDIPSSDTAKIDFAAALLRNDNRKAEKPYDLLSLAERFSYKYYVYSNSNSVFSWLVGAGTMQEIAINVPPLDVKDNCEGISDQNAKLEAAIQTLQKELTYATSVLGNAKVTVIFKFTNEQNKPDKALGQGAIDMVETIRLEAQTFLDQVKGELSSGCSTITLNGVTSMLTKVNETIKDFDVVQAGQPGPTKPIPEHVKPVKIPPKVKVEDPPPVRVEEPPPKRRLVTPD